MNIFMIAYSFPPLLFPATMCYVKLAKGLQEHGFKVTVLAVDPETFVFPGPFSMDATMDALLPPSVVVHRVKSWEKNPFVKLAKRNRLTREFFLPFLEPKKIEWTFAARRYIRGHIKLNDIDLILSCSQPHCNHLLGLYLKNLMGKPWIAYFSDPWTDNVYAEYVSQRVFQRHLKLEKQIITEADSVYFTSPEIRDLVMKKFPDRDKLKAGVLPHGFVPEWYAGEAGGRLRNSNSPVRFVQTGHFYGPRNPQPFFDALLRLRQRIDLARRFEFVFYGNMAEEHRLFVETHGLSDCISLRGTIPYLESLKELGKADYLLLIDAPLSRPGESVFLPSKLVDYLGSGKPIIGITPLQGASARVLRETGNIVCDINDVHSIVDTLAGIADGTVQLNPDDQAIDGYHYLTITRNIADSIWDIV